MRTDGRSAARKKAASPTLLHRLVCRQALARFAGGEAFLVGVMLLADLFTSMWRLLAADASLGNILRWVAAGIPAHAVEVLPVAYLFGITLSLAEMHADGELMVIWGSGISVQNLSLPIVIFSALMAGTIFLANDWIAIPSSAERDALYKTMTGQKGQGRQISDVAIMDEGGAFVYRVGYYDPAAKRIVDVDIVGRDLSGEPRLRILAPRADWSGKSWNFPEARIFSITESGGWTEKTERGYVNPDLDAGPSSFGIVRESPTLMKTGELGTYIGSLGRSGLPSVEAEVEFHKRYSFLFTPIIVCGLSIAFAGLFKKNSLLMSLLFSLGTATVYYVAQMLGSLAAKTGWVSPVVGIWSVTIAFLAISTLGYLKART